MAEVSMDLAELKQLESKIDQLEKDKKFLEDNQSQVVVHNKGYILGYEVDHTKAQNIRISYTSLNKIRDKYGFSNGMYGYEDHEKTLSQMLSDGIIQVNLRPDLTKNSKEYINLSEVTNQIKDELSLEYSDKLNAERTRANKAEVLNNTIASDYEKQIIGLVKTNSDLVEDLKKSHEEKLKSFEDSAYRVQSKLKEEIKEIKQEFEDFKLNKERVSLEEQLVNLQKELNIIKSRSFIKRLFNL